MRFLSVNDFLKNNALWLALGAAGVIVLVLAIIFFTNRKGKKKVSSTEIYEKLLCALGGIANVDTISARGSRLTIILFDKELLDEQGVKDLGVASLIKMSAKIILVIGQEASDIAKYINQQK